MRTKRNDLFLMGTKKKRRRCKADCSLLPSSEEKTVHQPRFDFGTIWIRIKKKSSLIYPQFIVPFNLLIRRSYKSMEKEGYRSLSRTSCGVHKHLGHECALGIACRRDQ